MKSMLWALTASLALAATGPANATIITFAGQLTGPNESPPVASGGLGTALVTIDDVLKTMRVDVNFFGLTSGVTASHIHCCTTTANTGTAGVATTTPTFAGFPSGVTFGSYDNTLNMTQDSSYNPAFITANGGTAASAFTALLAGIVAGKSYINIHTTNNTGGEIRAFLAPVAVPLPASAWLFLTGLAGLIVIGRRGQLLAH